MVARGTVAVRTLLVSTSWKPKIVLTPLRPIGAEYSTLRTEAAVRIPEGISAADYAPLLCAGVTTFNGIRRLNLMAGDIVAIQGLGGLGHLAVQYARKMGYRTVALSSSDSKREFAAQLGANEYIDGSKEDTAEALQKMGGAAAIVVTAPNPQIVGPLINGLAPQGKLLILALSVTFLSIRAHSS